MKGDRDLVLFQLGAEKSLWGEGGREDTADFVNMYDKMGDNEDEGTRFFPLCPLIG